MKTLLRCHLFGGLFTIRLWLGWDCVRELDLDVTRPWIKSLAIGPIDLLWQRGESAT